MEGNLFKWAGYLSGWCEEYFVLDVGSLSVYRSQNDMLDGLPAKQNINMGLCEIAIDSNDQLQWELVTNSQRWFLKAHSRLERQKWIQALGSCKACLLAPPFARPQSVSSHSSTSVNDNPKLQEFVDVLLTTPVVSSLGLVDLELPEECDIEDEEELQNLNKVRSTLLKKCEVAKSNIEMLADMLMHSSIETDTDFETVKQSLHELVDHINLTQNALLGKCSADKNNKTDPNAFVHEGNTTANGLIANELVENDLLHLNEVADIGENGNDTNTEEKNTKNYYTFFNSLPVTFNDVVSRLVEKDNQRLIPIDVFLDACHWFAGLFGRFGGTLLSPLETDVRSNIEKIKTACGNHTEKFLYLQELVQYEVDKKQFSGPNTGTQALFWLNLSLQTIVAYLTNLLDENSESWKVSSTSFSNAYSKVLAQHHNWMVQRLFKMGVKMLPDYKSFLASMSESKSLTELQADNENWEDAVTVIMTKHSFEYTLHLRNVSEILCELFAFHKVKP